MPGRAAILFFLGTSVVAMTPVVPTSASTHQPEPGSRGLATSGVASAGLQYLRRAMDQYHDRFAVYDDVSECGNHFHAWAKIPNAGAAVTISGSWTAEVHSGATAIRCEFQDTPGANFGGFYFLNGILPFGTSVPLPNFGTEPDAGIDLAGATELCFYAKGETGSEVVDLFMGGVGRDPQTGNPVAPHPDSTPVRKVTIPLDTAWTEYCIDLSGADLSYVLGGFGWVASDSANPGGAVFYVDDIEYRLNPAAQAARLDEHRFLRSFTTAPIQVAPPPVGDFDHRFRSVAFTYDNALALLAFLSEDSPDGLRRAEIIGRAFLYAQGHDRIFTDGRLRDAYRCGDLALPPGWEPLGSVSIPGYYDEPSGSFFEVGQETLRVGNLAWAMTALLALFDRTGDPDYLDGARLLGDLIHSFRSDAGSYPGFRGGIDDPEGPSPIAVNWSSTEHNLDVHAAFSVMFDLTGEMPWQVDAQQARSFVETMWEVARGCYLAGTLDPDTRNDLPGQLPLDTQSWSVLATDDALALHPQLLQCVETFHRTLHDGFNAFDFNDDGDGVWLEGTAQMALAYLAAEQSQPAQDLQAELERAQMTPPWGDGEGIAAACHDGVDTGFGFFLFRRLHVAATAWHVFAQHGFNPYYAERLPFIFGDGFESGDLSAWSQTLP